MKIRKRNWIDIETLGLKAQYFYIWTLNHKRRGDHTNELSSYNFYKSLDDEAVKPTITDEALDTLKILLMQPNIHGNDYKEPSKLEEHPKYQPLTVSQLPIRPDLPTFKLNGSPAKDPNANVQIDDQSWRTISKAISLFIDVDSNYLRTKALKHIQQEKLTIIERYGEKIDQKNHINHSTITDHVIAGQPITDPLWSIK